MAQWEYLTLFLEAKLRKEDEEKLKQRFSKKNLPKFSPEAMIPELDQLGAAGWELVHMEPVPKVGGKGDILFGAGPRWTNQYFCVFKRMMVIKSAPPEPRPLPPQQVAAPPPAVPPVPPAKAPEEAKQG